jgi:predicted AAA+ superfamily ATPase
VKRDISQSLDQWLSRPTRKPLVLRGARQVGKTWLFRDLAARSGRDLIELNFERDPGHRRAFASNNPAEVLGLLSLASNRDIHPERSLLFLDEVQVAGEVLAKLRWFYEELPELPVAAAGSLLEFTLAGHAFSMPVGRVTFRQVEPMGFPEYLEAHGERRLLDAIGSWRPPETLSDLIHAKAMKWFNRYSMVGGMPAVVAADVAGEGAAACRELQRDLLATYRADFAKYSGRMDRNILDSVLLGAAHSLGRKFVYSRAGEGVKQHQGKHALELLASARLCDIIRYTSANGLPLGAEVKDTFRKVALLDVGLLHALLGTPATRVFPEWQSLAPMLRGQLTEQLAAQTLRLLTVGHEPSGVFYWQREGGRPGEIDFIVQLEGRIIPLELKAGAAGSMKSLHQFMFDKGLDFAVRCDTNSPSLAQLDLSTTQGSRVAYTLLSIPLYLLWNLSSLLER